MIRLIRSVVDCLSENKTMLLSLVVGTFILGFIIGVSICIWCNYVVTK